MKRFTSGLNSFQVLASVTSESELKLAAGHGLLNGIVMAVKLVANGCPNKIGTVRVEPFLHEQIDMTKVNIAEVDRYLLTIACLRSKLADDVGHLYAI